MNFLPGMRCKRIAITTGCKKESRVRSGPSPSPNCFFDADSNVSVLAFALASRFQKGYNFGANTSLVLADGNPRQKKHPLLPDLAPAAPSGAAEFSPGREPWVGIAPSQRAPEGAKEGATTHTLTPHRGYELIAGLCPRARALG